MDVKAKASCPCMCAYTLYKFAQVKKGIQYMPWKGIQYMPWKGIRYLPWKPLLSLRSTITVTQADKIATGHNADDIAETVLLNILRGDLPRLSRCAAIITGPCIVTSVTIYMFPDMLPLEVLF